MPLPRKRGRAFIEALNRGFALAARLTPPSPGGRSQKSLAPAIKGSTGSGPVKEERRHLRRIVLDGPRPGAKKLSNTSQGNKRVNS